MSKQTLTVRLIVALLAVVISGVARNPLAAASQASQAPAEDSPGQKLRGSWKMTEIEARGRKRQPPIEMVFTFNQDTVEQQVAGRTQSSNYKLDLKNPQHLDIIRERDGETRTFKMIFSIEEETLKMCAGRPGADRPSEFTSQNGYTIQRFQRVKK